MRAKCVLNIMESYWNPRFRDKKFSSYAHVVHTTAKQVISRHGKNENVCEKSKNEKCTCKACKAIVCEICKFATFLLPSLSCLLKPGFHIVVSVVFVVRTKFIGQI